MKAPSSSQDPSSGISRRRFLANTMVAGVVLGAVPYSFSAPKTDTPAVKSGSMPTRLLGKTGVRVSVIGLGGYHIGVPKEESEATKIIRTAIDQGLTFMDNCWDYHNGKSEQWMGNALKDGYRDKVFLMSKIDGHSKDVAAKQIEESLKRLQTDRVDLMQFHEVIRPDDPDKILGPGGSMEAMLEAQKAGKVRFIGFTGHKDPEIHLKMINMCLKGKFPLDAVQMPLNVMDTHYKSFEKRVLPVLVQEKIGVLGMKSMGAGHVLKSGLVQPKECLQYALSLPTSVVITGIDKAEYIQQAVDAATSALMDKQEVAALLAKTAPVAAEGKFEPFKTTTQFDGTTQNPHWLG